MAKLVRRQHLVSNFYLRGFADERGQIRRVELPGTRQHNVGTNNASVAKDFYTITLPDGTRSDIFEKIFGDIEDAASSALRRIADEYMWPVIGESREALAAWVALQHLRSEGVRNGHMQMQAQLIKLVVGASGKEALRELISKAEGRSVDDFELDQEWADITKPTGPDLIPSVDEHLRSIMQLWAPTIRQMAARTWTLYRFQRRCLITSDHPVSLAVGPNYPAHMGVGLATAEAFVVPLNRRVGLVMGDIDDSGVPEFQHPGSTKMAKAFIGETIRNSRRYLYHHPDDTPLVGLSLPDPNTQEIGAAGDDWVREEGLFGQLSQRSDESKKSRAPRSPEYGKPNRGFTIDDLQWPIPRRRSNVRPRQDSNLPSN
ncbi:DUF4238 domain-containing protein [Nonomuraea sp. NPDC004186]